MTIRINPDVFNTHKAYDSLVVTAEHGADRLEQFVHKLVSAADLHESGARAHFQLVDLDMGEESDTINDFGLLAQNVINDNGDVDKMDFIDISFGVHKDQFHLMQAAAMLRYDSSLVQDEATGAFTLNRPNPGGMLISADHVDELANTLFSWVFDRMPEADKAEFMKNCEDMGLVDHKPSIGFGAELTPQPSSESAPSVH